MDAISLLIGFVVGAGTVLIVLWIRRGRDRMVAESVVDAVQSRRAAEMEQWKAIFGDLSRDALSRNAEDFLNLAGTRLEKQTAEGAGTLESKKQLIDASLTAISSAINTRLAELQQMTQTSEKDRRESVGAIKSELARATESTARLNQTTNQLREALASPQRRGQWGERMAEDVLHLIGLEKGVNYHKQTTVEGGRRPDYTFLLPGGLVLHMDVKFPLDNYVRAIESPDPAQSTTHRTAFLRDVRKQIKDVASREYINPDAGTVDCALVFIPNEQIYGFIHEHDSALFDDALVQRVILCSPLTLYAVLAVVRQAVSNFNLQRASHEILSLLADFRKEWKLYGEVVDKMGKALNQAVNSFESLSNTRTRALDRKLDRIDDLQRKVGQESAGAASSAIVAPEPGGDSSA
ncbi:MAG: DNA recombination protein RmuC [Phycisphaerales bacterium]|nr:DNA recombination protein RmuC [Phycisphaerales bacterium]